jgi:hypothetical protein
LILKGLSHEIFSAFHRTSEESEEQSINSRLIWQRISERIEGKVSSEKHRGKYLRKPIRSLERISPIIGLNHQA